MPAWVQSFDGVVRTQIQLSDEQVLGEFTLSMTERRRRAIEAAGRFHSGERDTSARHDEVLADAFR